MKQKILLINPVPKTKQSLLDNLESTCPPIGLLYIASVLRKNHSVKLFDEYVSKKSFIEIIEKYKPNYVAISSNFSFQFPRAVEVAKNIKKYFSNIKIIIGGAHITGINTQKMMGVFSCFDYAIKGDGEYVTLDVIENKPLKKIQGLIYRDKQKIISNGMACINDLDKLPLPARDLVNLKKYKKQPFEYHHHKNTFLVTSRGCLFKCMNCLGNTQKYRNRSPKNILDELLFLKKKGVKDLTIYDPTFTMNPKRAERICDLMIKNKIKMSWFCETRADTVNFNLLKKMKKAGCCAIFYGVESGSERILKKLGKKISKKTIKHAVYLTNKAKIKAYGGFMFGYPFESKNDFQKTINFAKELDIEVAWFNILTPLPGTDFWNYINNDENDLTYLDGLSLYSVNSSFKNKILLKKQFKEAILSFYLRPKIIFKLIKDVVFNGSLKRRFHLLKLLTIDNPVFRND
jgi:anaerobic magnesium-protoporphyrin IX monomethyl ester cyclase